MIDWDAVVVGPTTAAFGEAVTLLPKAGGSYPGTGVFDENYLNVTLVNGEPTTSVKPMVGIQLSQFLFAIVQGDKIYVQRVGKTYVIKEIDPDGKGAAKLLLNLAPNA